MNHQTQELTTAIKDSRCRGKEILLMDNDPASRQTMIPALEKLGYKVDGAGSGQHVLDSLMAGKRYDMIILDRYFPDMTTLQAIWKIRRWQMRGSASKLVVLFPDEIPYDVMVDLYLMGVVNVLRKSLLLEYIADMPEECPVFA